MRAISTRWLSLFRTLKVCCDHPFLSLREECVFEKMLGCMTVWSSKKVPLSRKDVFTQIAKDVVGQALDHGISIDYSIGISIDTLVETSTDFSIGMSIDAFGQALMRGLNMLTKLPRSALALL
ncbi:hypothetical protein F2Q68_00038561 [Brassica cretica]|uniref:Uncharacterized protein n=1 Tax=Brassica cretica TaxID=69181 RepID=A0A8S9ML84_BRACR|nr:hypothetical protein F2Q68_00038561 [Brassica cretica]